MPEHAAHRSRWPVVGAAGAGLLYAGVAMYALGAATGLFPGVVGGVAALVGGLLAAGGLVGWLDEAFLGDRITGAETPLYRQTMLLFLGTDVATFAAGFVYYAFVRVGAWPPADLPGGLLGALVVANTAVLLVSSGTYHLAVSALDSGNETRFTRLLGVTLLLGVVFLGGQAYEYVELLHEGFGVTGVFASAFYGLTALHGLHVALGVVLIGIVFTRARRGAYAEGHTSVETVELYWHFVDAVWLFLVVVLYVGATVG
ncbi:cytochrome c oxidase subunit 3 [Halorarius halobius]|uniref:cytochrome c oxidase subunit 3 n=1 Tax=Halorarius halobius TaxID=2962671 RepID=UPI0020CC4AB9|nr:cytochrome c oxidase subunit 3 [Halorarius halobius]